MDKQYIFSNNSDWHGVRCLVCHLQAWQQLIHEWITNHTSNFDQRSTHMKQVSAAARLQVAMINYIRRFVCRVGVAGVAYVSYFTFEDSGWNIRCILYRLLNNATQFPWPLSINSRSFATRRTIAVIGQQTTEHKPIQTTFPHPVPTATNKHLPWLTSWDDPAILILCPLLKWHPARESTSNTTCHCLCLQSTGQTSRRHSGRARNPANGAPGICGRPRQLHAMPHRPPLVNASFRGCGAFRLLLILWLVTSG